MIPKTKIIPRLSIIYKEIFIKSPYDLSSKENAFWDEFFLLSPKYSEFKNYLKNCDAEVLHFLTGKCIFYTQIKENEKESKNQENENNNKLNQIDSTRITNAFKNLSILFQVTSHYPDFFSLLFGCSDVSNETLQILLKNIVYLLEKAVNFDDQLLSNLLIFLNVSISCYAESNDENEPSPAAEPKIQRVASSKNINPVNPFIRIFNTSSILNSLLNLLIIKREAYGNFIITFISLISYYSKYNAELSFNDHNFNHYNAGNAYESFLSNLENKRQLVIIAAHILDKFSYKSKMLLEDESMEAKNSVDDQKPAVASFFGLFLVAEETTSNLIKQTTLKKINNKQQVHKILFTKKFLFHSTNDKRNTRAFIFKRTHRIKQSLHSYDFSNLTRKIQI